MRLDPGNRRRAPGHGRPEEHVLVAAVAAQQHGPHPLNERAQGQLPSARQLLQSSGGGMRKLEALFGAVPRRSAGLAARRPVHAERGRRLEPVQGATPERFDLDPVLLLQPGDEVSIRAGSLESDLVPVNAAFVEQHHVLQQQGQRPAIEENVMMAPHQAPRVVGDAEQGQAHEGGLAEVEPPSAIRGEERRQSRVLLLGGQPAPVLLLPGKLDPRADELERLAAPLPQEGSAQDRMPVDHQLPGPAERLAVEIPRQRAAELLDVHPRLRRVQGVKEQSGLERGQGIHVLDIALARRAHASGS